MCSSDLHRILTRHFRIDESLVDLVFDAPANIRRIQGFGAKGEISANGFPSVTIRGEAIDSAAYLQRQGFGREVLHLIRLNRFRDPFITDRLVVDRLINKGTVVGTLGRKVAVTFVPPFAAAGETLYVEPGERGGDGTIPIVLETPRPVEGYTLSKDLPAKTIARIRPGMRVVRR